MGICLFEELSLLHAFSVYSFNLLFILHVALKHFSYAASFMLHHVLDIVILLVTIILVLILDALNYADVDT